jgi:hypothetical protein
MTLSRRTFLAGVPAALALAQVRADQDKPRLKIAAVVTTYYRYSHAEHIVDRFLDGYGWEGRHHRPPMDVVSLYVDQVGANDLSRERAERHPEMKIYPSIGEALTLGGKKLAVDAVLLVGEHGKYPPNEKGQVQYPRYQFFKQIVEVFKNSNRVVPVYNDKHLSWNWDWAKEMVETSKRMGFPLMAGSSVPVAHRQPPLDMPLGAEVEEAVCLYGGGIDGGDIHGIEGMQCLVERRRGGETGVAAVQALRDQQVWEAFRAKSWAAGGFDPALFEACLCRSNNLQPAREGFNHIYPTLEQIQQLTKRGPRFPQGAGPRPPVPREARVPIAYRYEYRDGLKVTMLALGGVAGGWTAAARLKGGEVFSVLFYLPYYSARNFFNPLAHHIETMFLTGKPPYPIERTLLTTGLTAAGVESLYQKGKRLETPHLAVAYQPTKESTFWRT